MKMPFEDIQFDDIQALVLRGYPTLKFARFFLIKLKDIEKSLRWLRAIVPRVNAFDAGTHSSTEASQPISSALHIAFSKAGLAFLGLQEQEMATFSRPFREGMTAEHRSRALGDHGANNPNEWCWGGSTVSEPHVLLLCYGRSEEQLLALLTEIAIAPSVDPDLGLETVIELPTQSLPNGKEHFGFKDGISQPKIRELSKVDASSSETLLNDAPDAVHIGEFVLGYPDEYGEYPKSPAMAKNRCHAVTGHIATGKVDSEQRGWCSGEPLVDHPSGPEHFDLGKNGSYLVFRQIEQRVADFWQYMLQQSETLHHPDADCSLEQKAHWLAAKMMGRWASGAPLILMPNNPPEADDPVNQANDFTYHEQDAFGYRCPLGAHIRRAHPRDSLDPKPGTPASWAVNRRHRIIRRGRSFGRPLSEQLQLEALMRADDDQEKRGLHFICFNTDIERQFEFIQQSWINNKKQAGLCNDADPLMGDHDPRGEGVEGQFTLPDEPVRQQVKGLGRKEYSQFTQMMGGAYFFMPGLKALHFLTDAPWRHQLHGN